MNILSSFQDTLSNVTLPVPSSLLNPSNLKGHTYKDIGFFGFIPSWLSILRYTAN
ncbi:MAG: hypothetical protein MSA15_00925 [Clostridium sp.]|nr:hypothetical protein [Clostridium sp.]